MNYYENPAVNKSTLWEMRKSPLHYWHLMHDTPREDTKAFAFGRAVHASILTPTAYKRDYAVMPDGIDKRTKAGKEEYEKFCADAEGREIISAADADIIRKMTGSFRKTPAAMRIMKRTRREKPLFWTDQETGVDCKCRIDALNDDVVIDFKTAADASTKTFSREALRYGYDLQAAMYLEAARANGYHPKKFVFIVQEKSAPYLINIIHAGEAFIDRGLWIMRDLLGKYKTCRDTDTWPGYGENELILNEWEVIDDE
jgi:hypothetical protein